MLVIPSHETWKFIVISALGEYCASFVDGRNWTSRVTSHRLEWERLWISPELDLPEGHMYKK
jgi:hypothetical protein